MQCEFIYRDSPLRAPAIHVSKQTCFRLETWPCYFCWAALCRAPFSIRLKAATLEGTVLDPSGRAVPQAHVNLLRSLVVVDQRETDSQGTFKFAGSRRWEVPTGGERSRPRVPTSGS